MTKIVINRCHGGFGLSEAALALYKERAGITDPDFWAFEIPRDSDTLVAIVEELGSEAAGGKYADLRIVDVPDDVEWDVEEYDGMEWVAEKHRTWC